jgi:hypothetical protein
MALTTEIVERRPRFYYVIGDRKSLHMVVKDIDDAIADDLKALEFTFNHDGVMGTAWYQQAFTEDDLLAVLRALDALPQPVTIQADLLRLYWEQTGLGREP